MTSLSQLELIGTEVAIKWSDGSESYFPMDRLRAASPSAETAGERDLLGQAISPDRRGEDFGGITVTGWAPVGGYGIQFHFSDGHRTGIYSFDYLKGLEKHFAENP